MDDSAMPLMRTKFSVACPGRTVCDNHARVFARQDLLASYFCGTQRGTAGIPGELTYLNPLFGYWMMGTRRVFSPYRAEWLRSAAHPLFDRWVQSNLRPGNHLLTSYGYAPNSMKWVRAHGGLTFLDAGNSHPAQFWEIVSEEHRRWKVNLPPYPPHWNRLGRKSVEIANYIFSPSSYVSDSFLSRGFPENQIIQLPYPIDLRIFQPSQDAEPKKAGVRLNVICTGSVSLRKGAPYLLEALRIVKKERPATLHLMKIVESSMKNILPSYPDIDIEWHEGRDRDSLPELLKSCDVFALLSLEDGFALTVAEALSCGLPAVVSEHTGARDLIKPSVNGEIVPIRDPAAAATAILRCHDRLIENGPPPVADLQEQLAFPAFEAGLLEALEKAGVIPPRA